MYNSIDWQAISQEFSLDPNYIHLANCIITTHPLCVKNAIDYHRKALDANPLLYTKNYELLDNQTLTTAAEYLVTETDHIALTQSTTMGLGIIHGGLQINHDEEILTTTHDHYSSAESLRFKCKQSDAKLIKIALYEDPFFANPKEIITRLLAAITDKTRIISLTWVHSSSGVKLPIKLIADALSAINYTREINKKIILCVDGLHGFGIEDFSVNDLGCDFFIAGCHKSFYGPRGTGIIWGHEKAWKYLNPIIPSFNKTVFAEWIAGNNLAPLENQASFYAPGGFQAFEHRWALSEAFKYHLQIGKNNIAQHIHSLSRQCKTGLMDIRGIKLLTPETTALSSGMVCFTVNNSEPAVIVEKLLNLGVIVSQTPYHHSAVRFAPSIFNTPEEINLALNALEHVIK